jgi:hypothetical protein
MRRYFFHGGVPNLEVGGYILPPCETGYDTGARDDRVYVTTDLLQAICCALIEKGMVYLVQPLGRLGPDDGDIAGGPNYTARRALILARACLPPEMETLHYADFHGFHRAVVDLELTLTRD